MFVSVILQAVVMLIIVLQLKDNSPLLFGSGLALGLVIGNSLYLTTVHRQTMQHSTIWKVIFSRERLGHPHLLLAAVARCDFAIFGLSIVFLSPAVATIIFGIWPVFFILFLQKLARAPDDLITESRYHRISTETVLFISIAFIGLAFVISSQHTTEQNLFDESTNLSLGVLIAISGALLWALSAFGYRWGTDTYKQVISDDREIKHPHDAGDAVITVELVVTLIGVILSTIPAVLLLIALGLWFTPKGISFSAFSIAVLAGTLIDTPALILVRRANLGTKELGVNALGYLAPVTTLGLLAVFSHLGTVRIDFVAIGTAAIVSMNLFLNFDPERRLGFNKRLSFKALVISLWAFGSLIYLRDRWFGDAMVEWSSTDYWSILTVVATVFTLLLSFRVTRLHSRTTFEEYHMAVVFRKLEYLVAIDHGSLDALMIIDSTTDPSYEG